MVSTLFSIVNKLFVKPTKERVSMYSSTITEYEDNKGRKSTGTENGRCSVLNQPSKEHIPAAQPLIWRNIIVIASLHVVAIYLFATRYHEAKFWTWIWEFVYAYTAGVGITAGAHRLWAHRSYKARLPLKILIAYLYCMAGQTHPSKWVRVHRTHHKFTDTSADPHNSNRGFFFSHIGWLMMKHHPDVKKYGKVDMSDMAADPVIRFVDKTIKPTENPAVSFITLGEGWHNYHHCFPWDYKAAELPLYRSNLSTAFIDFMAWLGWAYDLKTVNSELIDRYSINHGDSEVKTSSFRRDVNKMSSK
ncbi:acyl-CoA desaturase 1-like isoform X8 [Pseudomyrmex gracilis]|uniref:acyl-CoA desaturase 1-like isoform X8 n=1 Tax=Pseudomyrmex gracilis TaxID=219809 RepID=UPI000994B9D9|nr:acyl-CoA desaturase 1-like isoform X8 [Pseudomyrmex gracilis]